MQKDLHRLMRDPNLLPSEKQDLISRVTSQAASMNMSCYLVGGFVRDLLLEKPVNDFDFVLEGDAIQLGSSLAEKFGGKLVTHRKFHTATWFYNQDEFVDLITARAETYDSPGALPTVKPSTIDDDLHRRDFTINAMAANIEGKLIDPLDGQTDLERGVIRVLYPHSFIDDPTRIFRAIRYEKRYRFQIESQTLSYINAQSLGVLSNLSGERIRHELDLIFAEENAASMLVRIHELGIFRSFDPEFPGLNQRYLALLNSEPENELGISYDKILLGYLCWLIDSTQSQVEALAKRLDFTAELRDNILSAIQLKSEISKFASAKPSAWTFRLDSVPLMSVYAVWLVTKEAALREFLLKWRHIRPKTTGEDLVALGIPPGPKYKEILSNLRAAWLDGEVKSVEDEQKLLKTFTSTPS